MKYLTIGDKLDKHHKMNKLTKLRNQLHELIKRNEIEQALMQLLLNLKSRTKVYRDVISLKQRHNANERSNRNNTISPDDYSRERSKISKTLLEIIDKLQKEDLKETEEELKEAEETVEPSPIHDPTPKKRWPLLLGFLLGGLIIGGCLGTCFSTSEPPSSDGSQHIASLDTQNTALQDTITRKEGEIASLNTHKNDLQAQLDNETQRLTNCRRDSQRLEGKLREKRRELNTFNDRKEKLEKDLKECRDKPIPPCDCNRIPSNAKAILHYRSQNNNTGNINAIEASIRNLNITLGNPMKMENPYSTPVIQYKLNSQSSKRLAFLVGEKIELDFLIEGIQHINTNQIHIYIK